MGNHPSADQPFQRATNLGNSLRFSKRERSPGKRLDRLRRSFRESFRRRKDAPDSSQPDQWHADEYAVRSSTCAFHVKYLGCVEVNDQKGIQTCEEALKVLRNSKRRPVRAIFYVSEDGLRVVENKTKGLIVDQIIEGVSFCAFDRNHEKGFSYICRDSTATRWMCHGFLALKESGKRLNHAVGCAFYASQERKQRREKDYGVPIRFDQRTSVFTRTGSFRQPCLVDRQQDSRERAIDVLPARQVHNPFAIERPKATPSMLERQGSCRGFNQLNQTSPFKRQLSLRVSDLPSNLERTRSYSLEYTDPSRMPPSFPHQIPVNPPAQDTTAMCQQVLRGPSLFSSSDDFGQGIPRTNTSTVVKKLFSDTITTTFLSGVTSSRSLDDLKLQSIQNVGDLVLSNSNKNQIKNNPMGSDGISCQGSSSSVLSSTNQRLTPILNQCGRLSPVLPHNTVNSTPAMNAIASIFETPAASPAVSTGSVSSNANTACQVINRSPLPQETFPSSASLASASPTPVATEPTTTPMTGTFTTNSTGTGLTDLNAATMAAQPIPVLVGQELPSTTNLQMPDPWLSSVTTQTTSATPTAFSTISLSSQAAPVHVRALSLDSAPIPATSASRTGTADLFEAKWAEIDALNLGQVSNTNPFIEPNTTQAFQVQLWREELQKSIADYYRNITSKGELLQTKQLI